MSRSSHRGVLLIAAVVILVGCGSPAARPQSVDEKHLKALAVLAGQYRRTHKGQPPANLDALKAHVKGAGASALPGLAVDPSVGDALFTSTRDSKPFVYRKPTGSGVPGAGGQAVVFYEAEGSGGNRWVAFELGGVEQVDAAKFKQLVPESP